MQGKTLEDAVRGAEGAAPSNQSTVFVNQENDTKTVEAFCQGILNTPEFRTYIKNGLVLGDIPAAVVCKLMDYGWGKPVNRIEVKDTTARILGDVPTDALRERFLFLAAEIDRREQANDTRMNDVVNSVSPDRDDDSPPSVH